MSTECVTYYKNVLNVKQLLRNMQDITEHSFEEPFYICDLSDVIEKLSTWKRFLPKVTPYYAIKCNTHAGLLETLVKLGVGFDCASSNEIEMVQRLGVPSYRIIFANPIKKISDIIFARERGIKRMTFDNECELMKVKKYYPHAELVLRIRCDARKGIVLGLGEKNGCDPKTEAKNLVFLAANMHVKVIGVSFHVGSGCMDYGIFFEAIAAARDVFDFSAEIGITMTLLDIGGGFIHETQTFSPVAQVINHALDKFFPDNDITIIAEPGRYFAASPFTLVTKVINVHRLEKNGKRYFKYFINCGVHAGFSFMKYGALQRRPELIRDNKSKKSKCSFWGYTCDPCDKLYEDMLMPELEVDDIIIFRAFGAYSLSLSTSFNGFEVPKVYNYINVKHKNFDSTKSLPCQSSQ